MKAVKRDKIENHWDDFKRLTQNISSILDVNMGGIRTKAQMDKLQKEQVELLMDLELQFRDTLTKKAPKRSDKLYQKFMATIVVENQNILTARPYFREKAARFSSKITPALKNNDYKELQKYHINFNFIKYAREHWEGQLPPVAEDLYQKIESTRNSLLENTLPLAISRARLFYESTPKSDITLLDLINAAVIGLVSGVDKYSGIYSKVFRSVCIGRMSGNMVDLYSDTSLHFYPSDKKILYKANIIKHRARVEDLQELTDLINADLQKEADEKGQAIPEVITLSKLHSLLMAQSTVSADATKEEDEEGSNVYTYAGDPNEDVEKRVSENEAYKKVVEASSCLDNMEKKVLRLRGVTI